MSETNLTERVRTRLLLRQMSLSEILVNPDLAKLGDVFLNLVYSLMQTIQYGKGVNARVPSRILASALKMSRLKRELPLRTSVHDQADAVEALSAYAWLSGVITIGELVSLLSKSTENHAEAFKQAVNEICRRLEC
ncbi:MAG: ribonuclease III family protein [Candidatus Bathyarchaeia archaeon]